MRGIGGPIGLVERAANVMMCSYRPIWAIWHRTNPITGVIVLEAANKARVATAFSEEYDQSLGCAEGVQAVETV